MNMSTPPQPDDQSIRSTLLSLEQKAWTALCVSGAAFVPLLSDSCTMLFPVMGGTILSRESDPTLKSTLEGDGFVPWNRFAISEVGAMRLGGGHGAGMIWYRVEAEREGVEFKRVCSSVWRVEGEGKGTAAGGGGGDGSGSGSGRGGDNDQDDHGGQEWKMVFHQQTVG